MSKHAPPPPHTRVRWEEKGGFSKHTLATLGVTNFSTFDLYVLTDETAAFTLSWIFCSSPIDCLLPLKHILTHNRVLSSWDAMFPLSLQLINSLFFCKSDIKSFDAWSLHSGQGAWYTDWGCLSWKFSHIIHWSWEPKQVNLFLFLHPRVLAPESREVYKSY